MGTTPRELTGEEAALYDRQIRLWGFEAQRKLASSHVLLTGSVSTLLGHELAKNIVLSGVARLALCANGAVTEPSFLGENIEQTADSLRDMNPHVDVQIAEEALSVVAEFSVVCAVGLARKEELKLAAACREKGVAFTCGRVAGKVGWVFLDLGKCYTYQEKVREGQNVKEEGRVVVEVGQMRNEMVSYCSYREAVEGMWGGEGRFSEFGWHVANALMEFEEEVGRFPQGEEDDQRLMEVYRQLCEQRKSTRENTVLVAEVGRSCSFSLAPVAAIVGGMWGREVVKVVSGRDKPLNNFFFFNAGTSAGSVETVGPKTA